MKAERGSLYPPIVGRRLKNSIIARLWRVGSKDIFEIASK
jgi:hypothetical protein